MRNILDENKFSYVYLVALPAYIAYAILLSLYAFSRDRFEWVVALFLFPQGLVGAVVSWLTRRPLFISTDGGDIDILLKKAPIKATCRIFMRQSKIVTVLSDEKKIQLSRALDAEPIVFSSGIDVSQFDFVPFEKKSKWDAISVSRYSSEKGLNVLLEAVKSESTFLRNKNFHLWLLGYGPEEDNLRKYVQRNSIGDIVSIVGRVPYSEVHLWYQRAAVFFLPSFREGLSAALLEAMASGCVCLVSNIQSNTQVVEEGIAAFTFKTGDSEDLARQLKMVISNTQALPQITEAAKRILDDRFSFASSVETLRVLLNTTSRD